ncbi:hypothetical protein ABMA27_014949 [Loxostege sticticalis]|uniref:CCHC-type domain-containing protein n=1 Tax=Loxostege sticticalis TaxID=481309 RepID=A0ABR3IAT5_LOXSC
MSNHIAMSIEKLVGRDNWASWSFAVKAYLQHEELWDCIESEGSIDSKKDIKAKSKLILLVDPINYVHIQDAKSAKEVWNNLSRAFQDSGLLRKVGLLKDLINTTLETSTSVEDYVNKILSAAHKLRNISFQVDDEWLGTLMLAGLPDEYKPMIMGIESSGVKISADLIKTKLLQEVKQSDTTAFYSNSKKNPPKNYQTKSKGPRCFHCNKFGHMSKNCWHKKTKSENERSSEKNKKGFIAPFSAMQLQDAYSWYVDSGASMHLTMHRDWLENLKTPPITNIRIADNKLLKVESCGNVSMQVSDGKGGYNKIQVRNVLYVPDLSTNLLSVSRIIKNGCKVEFDANGCSIFNQNNLRVAHATLTNGTYKLKVKELEGQAMVATTKTDSYTWHQHMDHLNMKDVSRLPSCTTGVKLLQAKDDCVCISCLEGKQTRQPFPSDGSRASALLERIHTYVDRCRQHQLEEPGKEAYHARSKHIDVRYHFVGEKIANKRVAVQYNDSRCPYERIAPSKT